MTSEELRGKITEEVGHFCGDKYSQGCSGQLNADGHCDCGATTKADFILSILETAMQGVIGEDTKCTHEKHASDESCIEWHEERNALRAEQRSNLLALVRGEKV